MLPRPLDITIALKAINLIDGLSATDKRVAAALIDHFNRKTGRCDPGLKRIADLLSVHTRTVIRSINRLVAMGLFRKDRHGGYSNRNRYEPIWPKFRELEAAWSVRFRRKKTESQPTQLSPSACQPCHLDGDKVDTQTCRINQFKETCSERLPKKKLGEFVSERGAGNLRSQVQSTDVARTAAERRWFAALHRQFSKWPITFSEVIDAIDGTIAAAATEAEIKQRGEGLRYIVKVLRLGSASTGFHRDIQPTEPAKAGRRT